MESVFVIFLFVLFIGGALIVFAYLCSFSASIKIRKTYRDLRNRIHTGIPSDPKMRVILELLEKEARKDGGYQ